MYNTVYYIYKKEIKMSTIGNNINEKNTLDSASPIEQEVPKHSDSGVEQAKKAGKSFFQEVREGVTGKGVDLFPNIPVAQIQSIEVADKKIEELSSEKWSKRCSALGKFLVGALFTAAVIVAAIAVANFVALILTPITLIPVIGPIITGVVSIAGGVAFGGLVMQPVWHKLFKPALKDMRHASHLSNEITRIEQRKEALQIASQSVPSASRTATDLRKSQ